MSEGQDFGETRQWVRAFTVQQRFNMVLLQILIEKGILTKEQAAALVDDVARHLPDDHPLTAVFEQMLLDFRQ